MGPDVATMSTITTDLLPSSIPKLQSMGLNWMMFTICFQDAMEAKYLWGHFNGSKPRPAVTMIPPTADDTPLATVEVSTTDNVQLIAQWGKDESLAKALLTHCIPNSTLMHIYNKLSVKERWDTIVEVLIQGVLRTG